MFKTHIFLCLHLLPIFLIHRSYLCIRKISSLSNELQIFFPSVSCKNIVCLWDQIYPLFFFDSGLCVVV